MRATMMRFELTATAIFRRAAELYSDTAIVSRAPAIKDALVRHTYGDFDRRSRQLASALRRAGLKKGECVATFMWNHHAHFESYFGIPLAGGVLHTLNLRLHPDEVAFIAGHAQDRFAVVDCVLWPLFEKVAAQYAFEKIFVKRWNDNPLPPGTHDYEEFLASGEVGDALPDVVEDDPLGVCYTSGTTGKPKGVCYSHRTVSLHSLGTALVDSMAISRRDTLLPVVPMFHAFAWGTPFSAVMTGAKIVLPGPHLDGPSLLDLMEKEHVTLAAGVPTIWMSILAALDAEPSRYQLQKGTRMVVGGSAAPESLMRGLDRHGLYVVHAWGMTETSPLGTVSRLPPQSDEWSDDARYAERAKQGTPTPFIELRAVGESGPAPRDGKTPGELEIRGAWVAASYIEPGDENETKWTADGWFRTGDVATLDAHGCVKITDRTKDLIKSGGEWISSIDLENLLMAHPAIKEAAVIAVPHPKWSERPLAVCVKKEGATVDEDELRAHVGATMAKFQNPDRVVFVDAIPRTSAGKFAKNELRDRFRDFALDK